MPGEIEDLEVRLGYRFSDRELLLRALTHKSLPPELAAGSQPPAAHNEQLEFLGDAVLGFLASSYLYRSCPERQEGALSRLKAHLVSSAHLYEVARELDIGRFLRLGRGEELSGGRAKRALLANAVEALLAAMYLDGGIEPCRRFLEAHVWPGMLPEKPEPAGEVPLDAKSALQELAQSLKLSTPRYVSVGERGPEHSKTFTVEARVGKEFAAQADGPSKKAAGQKAAVLVLEQLRAIKTAEPAQ